MTDTANNAARQVDGFATQRRRRRDQLVDRIQLALVESKKIVAESARGGDPYDSAGHSKVWNERKPR